MIKYTYLEIPNAEKNIDAQFIDRINFLTMHVQ